MEKLIQAAFENLNSGNRESQTQAYYSLLAATDHPVEWAYEVWDGLLADLRHKDGHRRAIAAQILCNLANSDPENRMLKDFSTLLNTTRDEQFVTARHALQSLWKIGLTGKAQKQLVVDGLSARFADCANEKNCTLIRYDILQGLKNLYDFVHDESIKQKAVTLIETEADPKYRKKYASVWKSKE